MIVRFDEARIEKQAEKTYEKYREYVESLEKHTLLGKLGRVTAWDIAQLGKQLEKFENLVSMVKEDGLSSLGILPRVAFDVITAVYGNSVIPTIASVQSIEEERGIVYFKTIKAGGSVIADPRTGMRLTQGVASGFVEKFEVGEGDGIATTFTATLPKKPVRPYTVKVEVDGKVGQDDGKGNILGIGFWGNIDYQNGTITVEFASAPASGTKIYASYQIDVESQQDLPQIQTQFEGITIDAKIYALKGVVGVLQSYALRNRFGIVAEDELARDLVVAINNEIAGDLIRKYNAVAPVNVNWSKTPPSGVSYYEHKMTIKDAIAEAEAQMATVAGRGAISVIIAGTEVAGILSTLPGFQKVSDGKAMGAHIFGNLDGMIIVRVNDASALPPNIALGVYNPGNPFEGAGVYAPYMPLTTTDLIPLSPNPLTNQKAVAVWAGVDVIVPQFVAKITVTA